MSQPCDMPLAIGRNWRRTACRYLSLALLFWVTGYYTGTVHSDEAVRVLRFQKVHWSDPGWYADPGSGSHGDIYSSTGTISVDRERDLSGGNHLTTNMVVTFDFPQSFEVLEENGQYRVVSPVRIPQITTSCTFTYRDDLDWPGTSRHATWIEGINDTLIPEQPADWADYSDNPVSVQRSWSGTTDGFLGGYEQGGSQVFDSFGIRDYCSLDPVISIYVSYELTKLAVTVSPSLAEVGEVVTLTASGSFSSNPANNDVVFIRDDGQELAAEILGASESQLRVRVPVPLLGDRGSLAPLPPDRGTRDGMQVRVTVNDGDPRSATGGFTLLLPHHLLYDQSSVLTEESRVRHVLPQFSLANADDVETFLFVGRSTDAMAGLRVLNTAAIGAGARSGPPLVLEGNVAIYPPGATSPIAAGSIPLVGNRNAGESFGVTQEGLWLITVAAGDESDFPAPFQVHLAGNTGQPRRQDEPARASRQDILFNHSAPRPQWLRLPDLSDSHRDGAEASVFKFADGVLVSPYAAAAIVPALTPGMPLVRAPDPVAPWRLDTPTATSPACEAGFAMGRGTVVDVTQLPFPQWADSQAPPPSMGGSLCAAVGSPDGQGWPGAVILDLGSGMEMADGPGNDLRVYATGAYQVLAGNSPYEPDLVPLGTGTRQQDFDLAVAGLKSARYVYLSNRGGLNVDAIASLNLLADYAVAGAGPLARAARASIFMRRDKIANNHLDPFLELIGADGLRLAENESGFGDPTSANLSDAAVVDQDLLRTGYFRVVARGYHWDPDLDAVGQHEFGGAFTLRLETGGDYDDNPVTVSTADEVDLSPQRSGSIDRTRERDSYLFLAEGGAPIRIVVHGLDGLDPMVELFDPEGFLIGASDNAAGRGSDAVLALSLPAASANGSPLSSLQAYRLVVSGIDARGSASWDLSMDATAHERAVQGGRYELKVFQGDLEIPLPGDNRAKASVMAAIIPLLLLADEESAVEEDFCTEIEGERYCCTVEDGICCITIDDLDLCLPVEEF